MSRVVKKLGDAGNTTIVTNAIIGKWRVRGSRIIARVDGSNQVLSSVEFSRIRSGEDVEAKGEECETGA